MNDAPSSKHGRRQLTRAAGMVVTLLAAAVPFALPACDGEEPVEVAALGDGCLINTDCESPLVCAFRRCHAGCEESRDCPAGQRCVIADRPFHVCQLDDERACSYNSQCADEQVCAIDGQCRDQCQADRDCVPEQVCATGTCAATSELVDGRLVPSNEAQTTGQPCAYTSECPEGLVCRDGLCNWECFTSVDCGAFGTCSAERRCEYPDAGVVYCVPGSQIACGCILDGGLVGNGEQICAADGSAFGACENCQPSP
jgi:hypothetical protein